jgi:predicted metal-dependent peptidase
MGVLIARDQYTSASEKMIKARTGLVLDHYFFGSLALRLKIVEDKTCRTGWTDGKSLGYNPAWIDTLSLDKTKGFIAHEVMHLALHHASRMKNRLITPWNKAADYVVNLPLVKAGFDLPDDGLISDAFDNMCVEQVYPIVYQEGVQKQPQKSDPNKPEDEDDNGDSGDDQNNQPNNQDDDQTEDQDGNGQPEDEDSGDQPDDQPEDQPDDQPEDEDSGDQPDDQPEDQDDNGQPEDEDPGGCGAVRPAKFDSKEQQEEFEQEWKDAVVQAANHAKSEGHMDACIDRLVHDEIQPKANWREVLRRFVDQSAKNDYSWLHPNRRYLGSGFILPSLHSEELGHIVVAIDTSGSIDKVALALFQSEFNGILSEFRTTCNVIYCDYVIRGDVEEYSSNDLPIIFNARGGSYTDFRPPFDWVAENGIQPICFIYLTDMCCSDFPEETDYPVLWVQTGNYGDEPPFGELVHLEEI